MGWLPSTAKKTSDQMYPWMLEALHWITWESSLFSFVKVRVLSLRTRSGLGGSSETGRHGSVDISVVIGVTMYWYISGYWQTMCWYISGYWHNNVLIYQWLLAWQCVDISVVIDMTICWYISRYWHDKVSDLWLLAVNMSDVNIDYINVHDVNMNDAEWCQHEVCLPELCQHEWKISA